LRLHQVRLIHQFQPHLAGGPLLQLPGPVQQFLLDPHHLADQSQAPVHRLGLDQELSGLVAALEGAGFGPGRDRSLGVPHLAAQPVSPQILFQLQESARREVFANRQEHGVGACNPVPERFMPQPPAHAPDRLALNPQPVLVLLAAVAVQGGVDLLAGVVRVLNLREQAGRGQQVTLLGLVEACPFGELGRAPGAVAGLDLVQVSF